ncbi:hypothetical protein [Citricoccus sp.]|uniref:hypothetical protein n=1 Tax=Citricoccus sp. TaxID=1978372 RepID=UPI002603B11F|nr:hypothetical protein [Citricoccus sp.]HRO30270.1 hypothetical protein [Citricoccus sp.]
MRKVSVATTIMPGHDHVSGLERLRGPVTVIRRCESLAELISVARSGLADVLLVAGDTGQLTLTFLDSVAADARGRRVAVVALSDVAAERERLGHLGVVAVPPETPPSDLAALLQEAVAAARHPLPVGSSDHDDRPPGATERPGRRAAGAIVRTGSSGSAAPGTRPAPGPSTPARARTALRPRCHRGSGSRPAARTMTTVTGLGPDRPHRSRSRSHRRMS